MRHLDFGGRTFQQMTPSHHDKLSQLRRIRQNENKKKMKNFSSGGGGKKMSTYLRSAKEKKRKKEKKWESTKKNEKRGFLNNGNFSFVKSFLLQQCS